MHRFQSLSSRLAFIDFKFGWRCLRIFGTYFPHSQYSDDCVEAVYETLLENLVWSRRRGFMNIIAGDFNAQVGAQKEYDDSCILGAHGYGQRNGRGDWLLQWCTTHRLTLGNTCFDAGGPGAWTYRNDKLYLQNDYILFDTTLFRHVSACAVCPDVDTGSAHRALWAYFLWDMRARRRKKQTRSSTGWLAQGKLYKEELDKCLASSALGTMQADTRQNRLEVSMVDATEKASNTTPQSAHADAETECIRALLQERRQVQHDSYLAQIEREERRRTICKEIQKMVRKRFQNTKQRKIRQILSEFRGLKEISTIKGSEGTRSMSAMKDSQGVVVSNKEDIAEVFAQLYENPIRGKTSQRRWLRRWTR